MTTTSNKRMVLGLWITTRCSNCKADNVQYVTVEQAKTSSPPTITIAPERCAACFVPIVTKPSAASVTILCDSVTLPTT